MFDRKVFLRLFWPVLIEQILATTIGMVNTMMVSGVGIHAISAVSIVDSLNFVIMNLFISFSTGATVVVAQLIGAKDPDKAEETASQAMSACVVTAIISGLVFIIFGDQIINLLFGDAEELVRINARIYMTFSGISYPFLAIFSMSAGILRASGNTRSPMRASIMANAANVIIGAFSIYIIGLGVTGAGIALLAARITGAGILAAVIFRPDNGIGIRRIALKVNKGIIGPVVSIGLPASIDGLIFNGGKLLIHTFITGLGTVAMAANGIANSITGLICIPGNAIAIVAVTIVGQAVGAGVAGKALRKIFSSLTAYAMLLLAVVSIIVAPLLPLITALYTPPPEVKEMAFSILYMILVLAPLSWPMSFILPACIRSTGDAVFTTIASIMSMWIFRVFGAWISIEILNWGLFGIWSFWCVDWFARGLFFFIRSKTSRYINRPDDESNLSPEVI